MSNIKRENKTELDASYYDNVYMTSTKYMSDPKDIPIYYVSWKFARDYIVENKIKLVIDIGCGPGHLAQVLSDLDIKYVGIDFSSVAISQANERLKDITTKKPFEFINMNAIGYDYTKHMIGYNKKDILITSFEFLEHVEKDLEVIASIPKGIMCCMSVPSYDSMGHVRYFENDTIVSRRYGKYLKFSKMVDNKFTSGKNTKIIYIMLGLTI